jgi:hypothetical protein
MLVKLLMVKSPLQSAYSPPDTDMTPLGGAKTEIDKNDDSHGIVYMTTNTSNKKWRGKMDTTFKDQKLILATF